MADILLSVGLQTGSAETSEFINQLQGVVNSLNKGEDTVIKMRPVLDEASIGGVKSQLSSIGNLIEQISQKSFNINLSLDNSGDLKERLGSYQEQVRSYVRNIQEAYSVIGQITKSSAIREMGAEANQYIMPAMSAIQEYGEALSKLEGRLDKTSTTAGVNRIATDAQQIYSAIQPLLELARDKGVLTFDAADFQLPTMLSEASQSASSLTGFMESVVSSLREVSQASQAFQEILSSINGVKQAIDALTESSRAFSAASAEAADTRRAGAKAAAVLDEEAASAAKLNSAMTQVSNTLRSVEAAQDNMRKLSGGADQEQFSRLGDLAQRLRELRDSGSTASGIISELKELKLAYADTLEEVERFKISVNGAQAQIDARLQKISGADTLAQFSEKIARVESDMAHLGSNTLEMGQRLRSLAESLAVLRDPDATLDAKNAAYDSFNSTLTVLEAQIRNVAAAERDSTSAAKDYAAIAEKINALQTTTPGIAANMESLREYLDVMRSADSTVEQKATAYKSFVATLEEVKRQYQDVSRVEKESANDAKDVFTRLKQLQSEINADNAKLVKSSKGSPEYAELTRQIEDLTRRYNELLAANRQKLSPGQIQTLGEMAEKAGRSMDVLKAKAEGSSYGIGMLENRLVYMFSLATLVMRAVRQLKQMVSAVVELDSAMTQLRIVTNASAGDYAAYGHAVAQTAQDIGASIKDLIDSATVFARLGYTLAESSSLAKYTQMLSNVGNIDVSSAQSALTAITKAFGINANEIESIMDEMVKVGNNFPISVSEIAEGMNNAGSALAAAGNTFEESVALLTAANTTVQNISKSSTGLRTITARIRGTKLELDELGESIETAKYQEALDILTKYRVSLTDNGEFRSTYDILKDIADVWNELSNMEQANIAEQLAGKLLLLLPVRTEMCA